MRSPGVSHPRPPGVTDDERAGGRERGTDMSADDRTEDGFLILADISGFTAFVTATELEHGAEVTGVLLEAVMHRLSPPLEIQELEGDAVFALGPDGGPVPPLTLFELLEDAFVAFRDRQRQMVLATT